MDEAYWRAEFQKVGALWKYPGKARREQPHCVLGPNCHSDAFFRSTIVLKDPAFAQVACADLGMRLNEEHWRQIKSVYGPPLGALAMAYQIAANREKQFGFTEFGHEGQMLTRRFSISQDEEAVVCDDVIFTGATVRSAIKALEEEGVYVAPFVLTLVNRSGLTHLDEREIIALVNFDSPRWTQAQCPYCKVGSEAISPLGSDNWARLRGEIA